MSQTDTFHLPNLAGAPFRALLNQILSALADQNAGSVEPENRFPGMVWLDTSTATPVFKLRNGANTGWVTIFTAETTPTKAQVGLSNVPNYSVTASLTDGSMTKFLLAAAGKTLQDNKLDKTDQAYDSARLGNKLASQYVLTSGTYTGLRAQATTKADVGLGNVQNYGITSSLTSNNASQYLSAKGGYDLNQLKVNKTTTVNGKALSGNISLTAANVGALPAAGGNLNGTVNYTPNTGVVIQFDGKTVLQRHSSGGALSLGADEGVVIGSGESRSTTVDNVSMSSEILHLSSDSEVVVRTNMQSGWASRKEFYFEKDGGFKPSNPGKTRKNVGVRAAVVGEIVEFGFDESDVPPGFFIMNGTRVTGGMNEEAYEELRDKCLGKTIVQDGNDFVVVDMCDFRRGKGSSDRQIGAFVSDAIRNITGQLQTVTSTAIFEIIDSGAFYPTNGDRFPYAQLDSLPRLSSNYPRKMEFNADRVVPTADENRPKFRTVLVGLYHGVGV